MNDDGSMISSRRLAASSLGALIIVGVLIHGGVGLAEELLVRADGSEYLGFDQGDDEFKTCNGNTVEYDTESGDKIEATDEICEDDDDDWPEVEAEEPPPA